MTKSKRTNGSVLIQFKLQWLEKFKLIQAGNQPRTKPDNTKAFLTVTTLYQNKIS